MGGARPAKSGRGDGRLALRGGKPFALLENRPGNRAQEGQREILEALARKNGRQFKDLPREEMEAFWETAKKSEGKPKLPAASETPTKP
jgi:hypothetical protein